LLVVAVVVEILVAVVAPVVLELELNFL